MQQRPQTAADYSMTDSPLAGRHVSLQRSGLKSQQQQHEHPSPLQFQHSSFQSASGNDENFQANHHRILNSQSEAAACDSPLADEQNDTELPSKFFTMENNKLRPAGDQTQEYVLESNFEGIQSPFSNASPQSSAAHIPGARFTVDQMSFASNKNPAASPTLSPVIKLSPDRKRLQEYEAELQRNEQSIHRLQSEIENVQGELSSCKRQLQQQINANAALQQSHSEIEQDRNNWETACKRHRESLNQLKAEYEQLLADRKLLIEKLQAYEEVMLQKDNEIGNLDGAFRQLKAENVQLMTNLEQCQEENVLLTEQLDELEKLKSQQYLKESEIDQLTQQLQEVQESAFVSSTMSLQDELLISQQQKPESHQRQQQSPEEIGGQEFEHSNDFAATRTPDEYTACLEKEVVGLRDRLSEAWTKWEKERNEKELFKTASQTEIASLKMQLARFGQLLQKDGPPAKDDPELPSFVDLNDVPQNNFSTVNGQNASENNMLSNNFHETINGLMDELVDAEKNILPPSEMESLRASYQQMWTSFIKVTRHFAQINQQDDALFSNSSINLAGSKSMLVAAGGAEWLLRFKKDIEQVLRETLTELDDLRLQRNKLRAQLKQAQATQQEVEESEEENNYYENNDFNAKSFPDNAQQIAEMIKQRNHEIAHYKAQLEVLRDELEGVRSGGMPNCVMTDSICTQTLIERDSDGTQTDSVSQSVKAIQTDDERLGCGASGDIDENQDASRILQILANTPLASKDSPSILRHRKRTSPLKAMTTVHEVKKLQSMLLKETHQLPSMLRRLLSSASVTLYTLMIWSGGLIMGVLLVSILLRSSTTISTASGYDLNGGDYGLFGNYMGGDDWMFAMDGSRRPNPPLYQYFEQQSELEENKAAEHTTEPPQGLWRKLINWLPKRRQ